MQIVTPDHMGMYLSRLEIVARLIGNIDRQTLAATRASHIILLIQMYLRRLLQALQVATLAELKSMHVKVDHGVSAIVENRNSRREESSILQPCFPWSQSRSLSKVASSSWLRNVETYRGIYFYPFNHGLRS